MATSSCTFNTVTMQYNKMQCKDVRNKKLTSGQLNLPLGNLEQKKIRKN